MSVRRLIARKPLTLLRASLVVTLMTALVLPLTSTPAAAAVVVPPLSSGYLMSTNPADHTPHAGNGEVWAYAQIGDTVYVGGSFTTEKEATATGWASQRYLFAYNRLSGAILSTFAPVLDNTVQSLAVSPNGRLLVGGAFHTVNGVTRRNLVALDPVTGATVPGWVGHSDGGNVRTMAVHGNQLYIGGGFLWVNGTRHALLARLDATTGAIDDTFHIDASVPRAGSEYVWTIALSPDGGTLLAGGNFTQVNGQARNQIVMVDTAGSGSVAGWSTERFVAPCYSWSFDFYVQSIDFSDDGSYFVVGANGGIAAGAYCDSITRFETSTRGSGIDATWIDYTGTDSVTAVEAADGVIYAAGHFRWLNNANGNDAPGAGAIDRLGIAAIDASNGVPINWNPRRTAGSQLPAGRTAWGSNVGVLWRGSDGLYFGHNSDGMGSEYHGRMGMFPLAGGRGVPVQNAPNTLPGYLYLGAGNGQLTKVPFDGVTLGAATTVSQPNLSSAGAAFSVANKLYWTKTDPSAPSGSILEISIFNGVAQPPWYMSYNSWFAASSMVGAFFLNGRMYYARGNSNRLYYRYLAPDSYFVGCTEFVLPTSANFSWSQIRGMTWVNGKIIYGNSVDTSLHSVPFDPTAARGVAVDGLEATLLAPPGGLPWSNATLFYANL